MGKHFFNLMDQFFLMLLILSGEEIEQETKIGHIL